MKILGKRWSPAKKVEYHGNIVEVPWNTNYLAVNDSGGMCAYESIPEPLDGWFAFGDFICLIANVELEGMDWKDSLVYVGDKEKESG